MECMPTSDVSRQTRYCETWNRHMMSAVTAFANYRIVLFVCF